MKIHIGIVILTIILCFSPLLQAQVNSPEEVKMERLHKEGEQAYYRAEYGKTLEKWQQGLNIAQKSGNNKYISLFTGNMGSVYISLGQLEKAFDLYKQALAIHRKIGDRKAEGDNLTNMGVVSMNLGQYEKALHFFEQALVIKRETRDRKVESTILTNMGMLFRTLSRYKKALDLYQQALVICRETGNKREEGSNLTYIGVIYDDLGSYKKALHVFEQALTICRETENLRGEISALGNTGNVFQNLGDYEKALAYYEEALATSREIGYPGGQSSVLTNMGVVYSNLGQYEKAVDFFEQALTTYREIGDPRGEGDNLTNMGVVYDQLNQYEKSVDFFEQALTIYRKIGDPKGEGDNLTNMGVLYRNLKQYEKALNLFEQALAIYRKIGDRRREGDNLTNTGLAYQDLGQYVKAEQAFSESLKICKEIGASDSLWQAQRGLASIEVKLNHEDKALFHYEQALDNIENMREGIADKEAKIGFMRNRIYVYDELIELLRVLHQKHPDKGYDKRSIEIFERKQGRIFLEEIGQSGARNFAGIPERILDQENELTGRLRKLQAERVKEGSTPEKNRDMKRVRELKDQIETIKAKQLKLQVQIKTDYPEFYALKYPKPLSLHDLQQTILQPGETMMIYDVMEKSTCLWTVNKDHFSLNTIEAGKKDLAQEVEQYRNLAISPSRQKLRGKRLKLKMQDKKEIPDLYSLLFPESIRKTISNTNTLYIIPTGPLYLLPFETLKNKERRYLIENQAVAYLSSASLLKILRDAQSRKKKNPKHPLLAFADPVYGEIPTSPSSKKEGETNRSSSVSMMRSQSYRAILGGNFEPLPETEDEVRAIKDILNAPDQSNPLWLGKAASRSNIFKLNQSRILENYRYLVFACHGIIPDEINWILQPALVLSDPDPKTRKNCFLNMSDVFGLSLNADLITLSACNTGRGKTIKGEGVMGLTRAFMYAGAPAITVTLWSVESQSAKELNVGFFKNLKQGKSKAKALRQIKIAMLRGDYGGRWQHPFFWGPLVVFGDGR